MSRTASLRLLLALLLLSPALLLAACSSDGGGTTTAVAEGGSPASGAAEQETTDAGGTTAAGSGLNAQRIYADASAGVVTIRSVFEDATPTLGSGGQGSGFVISDDGEIVTNAHVVTDAETSGQTNIHEADELFVEFRDRNQVPADVVGVDLNADIALLHVDPDGLTLHPLKLGDSEQVAVGTPVAAIGSPFGQEQSLSIGIVSATDRSIESLTNYTIDGALQTDASINPGNSGGPLISPDGRVIGVNQQINTTSGGNEGVGFAVPSSLVKRSVEDLRDDGSAEYGYIGVVSRPLYPQLAEKLGIDAPTGTLITRVVNDSPADKAGLRGGDGERITFQGESVETGGDVIVAVDGEKLVRESDLSRLVSAHRPGDEISLEVLRDGEKRTVKVTLEARPDQLN